MSLAPDLAVPRAALNPLAGTGGPLVVTGPSSLFRRSSVVIPAAGSCLFWPPTPADPTAWNGEAGGSRELSGPLLGLLRMLQPQNWCHYPRGCIHGAAVDHDMASPLGR